VTEDARIALVERVLGGRGESVRVGIGDDAAVVDLSGAVACSVDVLVEEVHFRRNWLTMADLGYRGIMTALSDLAAMGAEPRGVLSSLVLPPWLDDGQLEQLLQGQAEACEACGTSVIGGNLARGTELSMTTAVFGPSSAPIVRSGARPDDLLWLSGPVGLAAVGRRALDDGEGGHDVAKAAWRRPRARIAEGLALVGQAHAAIDISDGLALDAARLALASGVALVLQTDALGQAVPLADALYGGEDYALLAAAPADAAPAGFVQVGHCEAGEGVWLLSDAGREAVDIRGWDHFAGHGTGG